MPLLSHIRGSLALWMDGSMDDLRYQDDGWMIMKTVCNGTPFTVEKISPRAGLEPGTARSVGQRLTH